jgi:hypothetical protein
MKICSVGALTSASAIGIAGLLSACDEPALDSAPHATQDAAVQVFDDSGVSDAGLASGRVDSGPNVHDARASDPRPASSDGAALDAAQGSTGSDGGPDALSLTPFDGEGEPWKAPAPRATCAPGDQVDGEASGLSGDLRCNLEVIAKVEVPYFLTMAWYDDCAYVNGPDGTTVLQVAPDGTPTATALLTEAGFRGNWESMKASPVSGLLVGHEGNAATLSIADLTKDCAHPEIASSLLLNGWVGTSAGHAGGFSPDGTIYYAASLFTAEVFAVDLAVPKQPKVITTAFERGAHDVFVGKDGTRGYFTIPDIVNDLIGIGSFAVIDLSQVQARATNAKGTVISETRWEDGTTSQYPILLSYHGKDYLFVNDEAGSGACDNPEKPVWGYGRIFDMRDETNPKLASLVKTEASEPQNCEAAVGEGEKNLFGVSTHYCSVDRYQNPRLLSCGIQAGGVRVYDIRNPWRPKEVAYFSVDGEAVPGMQRIHVEKRELWLATQPGTFYVLRFSRGSPLDQILSD